MKFTLILLFTLLFIQPLVDNATGRSKGFGFVTMEDPQDALIAVKEVAGMNVDGRNVRVEITHGRGGGGGGGNRERRPNADYRGGGGGYRDYNDRDRRGGDDRFDRDRGFGGAGAGGGRDRSRDRDRNFDRNR